MILAGALCVTCCLRGLLGTLSVDNRDITRCGTALLGSSSSSGKTCRDLIHVGGTQHVHC